MLAQLKEKNIRVEINTTDDSLGKKINSAKAQKVPYVIVIGDKEMESGNLTIETRDNSKIQTSLDEFIEKISQQITNREMN